MLEQRTARILRVLAVAATLVGFCLASYAMPQAKPAGSQPQATKPAPAPAKAMPAAVKPAPAQAPASRAPARAAQPAAAKAEVKKPAAKQPEVPPIAAGRRDPFRSLLIRPEQQAQALPPGKRGLVIAQMSIDGIIRSPGGMLAMVTSPQKRTYFLREKDEVYNGRVERITSEAVIFSETAIDPFGKTFTREVVKRLYPVAGEAR